MGVIPVKSICVKIRVVLRLFIRWEEGRVDGIDPFLKIRASDWSKLSDLALHEPLQS